MNGSNCKIEDLGNGVKIFQSEEYKFSEDSIKLSKFCKIKSNEVFMDLCAGCGIIGFSIIHNSNIREVIFVEKNEKMCEILQKNANNCIFFDKIEIKNADLKNISKSNFSHKVDAIVCNPPYFELQKFINNKEFKHEQNVKFEDIVSCAKKILNNKGRFYFVFPAQRTCEAIIVLNNYGFVVKKMKLQFDKNRKANITFFEAVFNSKNSVEIICG